MQLVRRVAALTLLLLLVFCASVAASLRDDVSDEVEASARLGELTPAEKANSAVVVQGYWQAGAVEQFGARYGLPATYSPSRGFGFFGPPPDSATSVIYLGLDTAEADLRARFTEVERVAHLDDPMGIPGIDRMVAVWRCKGPKQPWSVMWDDMTTLYFDLGLWRDPRATTRPTR